MVLGTLRPVHSHLARLDRALRRGARRAGAAGGQERVEPEPGVVRPGRQLTRFRLGLPSTTHRSVATPTTMHASATLNAGHATGSIQSITAPSTARSIRFPTAPPSSRPTGSHSHGMSRFTTK